MPALMTVSIICIFYFIVAGHEVRNVHCWASLVVVMCVWIFYFSDGTKLMPR